MPPPGFEMLSLPPPTGSLPAGLRPFLRPLPEGPGLLVLRGEVPPGMLTASLRLMPSPLSPTAGGLPFLPAPEIPFGLIAFAIRFAFLCLVRDWPVLRRLVASPDALRQDVVALLLGNVLEPHSAPRDQGPKADEF